MNRIIGIRLDMWYDNSFFKLLAEKVKPYYDKEEQDLTHTLMRVLEKPTFNYLLQDLANGHQDLYDFAEDDVVPFLTTEEEVKDFFHKLFQFIITKSIDIPEHLLHVKNYRVWNYGMNTELALAINKALADQDTVEELVAYGSRVFYEKNVYRVNLTGYLVEQIPRLNIESLLKQIQEYDLTKFEDNNVGGNLNYDNVQNTYTIE